MKLFLDIDGVIVGRGRKPAAYVTEFLKFATDRHDCYWATTHCKGEDTDDVMRYIKEILPAEAALYCEKIKPTRWSHKKTEIFDYNSDFLWFEDKPFEFEKEILAQHGRSNSLVLVDLISNPNHLHDLIKLL
mgnify:CR=1 FL=1